MVQPTPAPRRRRLASVLLAVAAVAAIAIPSTASATTYTIDAATLSATEAAMVAALNEDRTERGLVPVRIDTRLMAIARARSNDMVAKHYFSHTQPDGRNVFDILTAKRITWYNAGEIIAWNNYSLDTTVAAADNQWMNSPGHKAIVISTDYNYVGVGLALDPDTGKKVWTAVYLKGPDRTGARSALAKPAFGSWTSSTTRTVKVSWSGSDPRLQVLTAGFNSFAVRYRVDGGAWNVISYATTTHSRTFTVRKGHLYEYRVSAKDNRGNRGAAVTTIVDMR